MPNSYQITTTTGKIGSVAGNTEEEARANNPFTGEEIATITLQTSQPVPQQRTLIDIANSRPDVLAVARSQGGDPFQSGTGANTWLNDWWNTTGKNEFPGVSLKQPLAEL